MLEQYAKYHKEKSRNIRKEETEAIIEIKSSQKDELLAELKKIEAIERISYLQHDGEYRG